MDNLNFYEIFNISENATDEQIDKAWRELSSIYHSDKTGKSDNDLKLINHIRDVLKNPKKRAAHDAYIKGVRSNYKNVDNNKTKQTEKGVNVNEPAEKTKQTEKKVNVNEPVSWTKEDTKGCRNFVIYIICVIIILPLIFVWYDYDPDFGALLLIVTFFVIIGIAFIFSPNNEKNKQ